MNSMPEQPDAHETESETWPSDFRSGYAQGYLDAVRIATQLSDRNLEAVLAAWTAER